MLPALQHLPVYQVHEKPPLGSPVVARQKPLEILSAVSDRDLLQYVYSIASAKGSHHGVTDETWTRLARRMVWIVAQYLLNRFEAWKSGGLKDRRFGALDRTGRWCPTAIRACLRRVFSLPSRDR